jgi:transglutaminase-like putative cysteine protease
MVLMSLQPLRLKKRIFLFAIGTGLISVSCFARSTFFAVDSTPYDRQMTPVSWVLKSDSRTRPGRTSLVALNYWMRSLRAMPYRYSKRWRTPEEVKSAKMGDCKGKAVLLYEEMRTSGARNVRLVIGKRRLEALRTHAWVEWETKQGTYLLDPTFNWTAAKTAERDTSSYVPFYAYDGAHKYRAFSPALIARHSRFSNQVASQE